MVDATATINDQNAVVVMYGAELMESYLARAEAAADRAEDAAAQAEAIEVGLEHVPFSYLGPVATNCFYPTHSNTSTSCVGINTASAHWTTEAVSRIKLGFVNGILNNAPGNMTEQGTGNALNLTCVIEYPAGVYTRVTLNGSNTIALPDNAITYVDWANVAIPANTKFMVHCYWTKQGGGQPNVPGTYFVGNGAFHGDYYSYVFTGDPAPLDKTGVTSRYNVSGAKSNGDYVHGPQIIMAQTRRRSFALIGDSRTAGVMDGVSYSQYGDSGEIARAIRNYGYINLGIGNDRTTYFIASHANRVALALHCTDIVLGYGANDIFFLTAAQLLTNTQTIMGYFPGKQKYLYTLPPVAVSTTDNYATLANQTPNGVNTIRTAYNDLLRAGVAGVAAVWEIADVLESSRNSSKWAVAYGLVNGPSPAGDPTHENPTGNQRIADSGAIIVTSWAQ